MKHIEASVIMPTLNKPERLLITLTSFIHQTNANYEIIIVDGNYSKALKALIDKVKLLCQVKYIKQNGNGRANARNIGIKEAKGKIIIFADDDLLVCPDFIEEHIKAHNNSQNVVVLGKLYQLYLSNLSSDLMSLRDQKGKKIIATRDICEIFDFVVEKGREDPYFKSVREMFNKNGGTDYRIPWIGFGTNNSSASKENIIKAGLFDEKFKGWGYESIELGYRLFKEGLDFKYNSKAVNYHLEHSRNINEKMKELRRNLSYFIKKHYSMELKLYKEFLYGKISLECFNESVKENTDLRITGKDSGKIYYKLLRILDENAN